MHHIYGFPAVVGAILFVAGASLWRYEKMHRFGVWLMAAGAFFLTVGISPWRDALAQLIASGTGLAVLMILDVVTAFGFWFEATHKPRQKGATGPGKPKHHHRLRTPVLGIAFAVCLFLTIASAARVLRKVSQSPGKTSQALGRAVTQVSNGHAARAMPHNQALMVFAIGCAVVLFLLIIARRHESHGSGKGQASIAPPSGRGTPGRSALPAGRGRR